MALATTTLSVACALTDKTIVVASATSIIAGRLVKIDNEFMQVTKDYVVASTTVPVIRGQSGTVQEAHVVTTNVTHGSAIDFSLPGPQMPSYPAYARPELGVAITATPSTLVLPPAGNDLLVTLNGTAAITLTIPVPTKDMDGCRLTIMSNGVAQHLLTFTGGLSGAGGSYDIITINATAPAAFAFIACNGLWLSICGAAISGTTTAIAGAIA